MSRQYRDFKVGDLFEYERGKVKAPKQVKEGNIPMVSETNLNNGVDRFVDFDAVHKGGCVTVSVNYARNVFYQEESFCASVNIIIIRNDLLNKYNGMYISSVLSSNNKKYSYTDKISKTKLMDAHISLPITPQGDPDWQYMEDFMKEIEYESQQTIETLDNISTLSSEGVSNYPEPYGYNDFKVGDLFEIRGLRAIDKNKLIFKEEGVEFVGRTNINNGVQGYIEEQDFEPYKGGTISVSQVGTIVAQYRENHYYCSQNIVSLSYSRKLNRLESLYITTLINKALRDSGFEGYTTPKQKDIKGLNIKLPITTQGIPDWQYMEDYMRNIEQESEEVINKIQNMS